MTYTDLACGSHRSTTSEIGLDPPFGGERPTSLREIILTELNIQSLPRSRVAAGALIMRPEAVTEALYFIVDGRVRLYRLAPNAEEVFLGELGPGDCLKCPRILGERECHMFAEASVNTTLEVLSRARFHRLRQESVVFNQSLVREVMSMMRDLDRRLYETSVMPMKVRLHAELLRMARCRRDGTSVISPPPRHQDLANRIGSQREAVSKELTRLEREGVIRRGRASVELVQDDVLRREMADWSAHVS